MTTEEFKPAEVFCLAEFLADEMEARGWTTDDVGVRMNTSRGSARDIFIISLLLAVQSDKLLIDDETFEGLARAFGVSKEFFQNLHSAWQKWPDRRSPFTAPDSLYGPFARNALDNAAALKARSQD